MKSIVFLAAVLASFSANANWFLRCDPPVTKKASTAAYISARATKMHINNIRYRDCLETGANCRPSKFGTTRSREESVNYVAGVVRICYQHVVDNKCAFGNSETKPASPYVCVWDKLGATYQQRVLDLGIGPD